MSSIVPRLHIFWLSAGIVFFAILARSIGFTPPEISHIKPLESSFENILQKLKPKEYIYNIYYQTHKTKQPTSSWQNKVNSYVVVDFETGEALQSKDAEKKVPIASLTKIMTAVVALDLANASDVFIAPSYIDRVAPTHIAIRPGEEMGLKDLIEALLITSANDAAEVVKNGIDEKYGSSVFIKAMNKKAKMLGLESTHFTNPQGFDHRNHFSSAKDLAILTHYALTSYPLIEESVRKDRFYLPDTLHKGYNWNGLLGVYPGVLGVKIGNTAEAGKTAVVLSEREGKKLLVVMLGAPGVLERDLWTSQLLDMGFKNLANLPNVSLTEKTLMDKYQTWQYF